MIRSLMNPPGLAVAAAALVPTFAAVSPQEESAPAGQELAAVVIRYDPASIYLTTELVQALCDSSVRAEISEGPRAGEQFELAVEAFPGREHQPPGVFPCQVQLMGARVTEARQGALIDLLLGQLEGALSARLTDGRVARASGMIRDLIAQGDQLSAALQAQRSSSAVAAERVSMEQQMMEAADRAEALEVEIEVVGANWRAARARAEEQEFKLRAAEARVAEARADLKRMEAGAKNGVVSQREVLTARVKLVDAEGALASDAARVQEATAAIEVLVARRESLEGQLDGSRTIMEDARARFGALERRAQEERSEASNDEAALAQELMVVQDRIARAERVLDGVIDVRVERW